MEDKEKDLLSIIIDEEKGTVRIARGYSSVQELTSKEINLLTIINEKILKGGTK